MLKNNNQSIDIVTLRKVMDIINKPVFIVDVFSKEIKCANNIFYNVFEKENKNIFD